MTGRYGVTRSWGCSTATAFTSLISTRNAGSTRTLAGAPRYSPDGRLLRRDTVPGHPPGQPLALRLASCPVPSAPPDEGVAPAGRRGPPHDRPPPERRALFHGMGGGPRQHTHPRPFDRGCPG